MSEEQPQQAPPAGGPPNFNELEKDILKFWKNDKTFEKSLEKTKDGQPYIFYDGPPFATGLPHYGSILPSVIKDTVPRYQTMQGRFVRRRWGWDCHGLPIENIVEQHLKISGKKQIEEVGVARFNQICRDNVLNYSKEWGKTINRIARWVDFENSYKTMDTSYMESVWWGIKQIWEKGLIYEDRKVLLYCPRCETPISNFEVAMDNSYRDVTEESVYAKFRLPKGQRIVSELTNEKTFALAWTTTPWTLPGNTALNVGPDISYVLIEAGNGERYIVAKDRLSVIDGHYETVAEFPGRSLEGLSYEPLYPGVIQADNDKAHKIYSADFVTTTDGTGIVHNAALYGEEDYGLAREKDLPREDMLDHKGHYLDHAPENLRGVFFKNADKIILPELTEKGLVYKVESYTHSYPHCYRCGTPLYYNALPAWFINIQKVKADLLANNENVNWYPSHLKHGRFKQGIENAPDWNISRNRYWATALPFWKCMNGECKHVTCVGSVRELVEKSTNFSDVYPEFVVSPFMGSSEEADKPASTRLEEADDESRRGGSANYTTEQLTSLDLHKPYIDDVILKCEKCGSDSRRVPEVVDCWVESGSMPFAELHYPFENKELFEQRFPSDFVVEYIPQTRAWFYVMHVVSSILFGRAPFKNVVTTGTILAEDGSKMSKSKKNYPDPNVVIEKYGADALRFYLLTSPVVLGEDLNFSEKGVQEVNRKVNLILYNVWSFLRLYTAEKIQDTTNKVQTSHVLDSWVTSKLGELQKQVTQYLDNYDTVRAGKAITEFINDLSTWYVRRSRDRMKQGGTEAEQALQTLSFVLVKLCKLLAPFMPFLSEFIYRDITGNESVHLEAWDAALEVDEKLLADMQAVREISSVGLAARKENSLNLRQPLALLEYNWKTEGLALSPELEALIADELNVKQVTKVEKLSDGLKTKESDACALGLDVTMTPELQAEGVARELERQIQDLRKKSGLSVGNLVDVYYNTVDEGLEDALLNKVDRKKTFVSQISKSLEVEVDYEIQAEVDGRAIWLGIVKI